MAVEYQYVGSNFTSITGLFTTADRLSGDIILDARLLPSSENAPKIDGFTFTNGVDTFSSSGFTYLSGSAAMLSNSEGDQIHIGDDGFDTNEAGQLVEADFAIVFNGGQKGFNVLPAGSTAISSAGFAQTLHAGTWTLVGTVSPPAPQSTTHADNGTSANLVGDNGNDIFIGTTGSDTITTGTGNNPIVPGNGNDLIVANGSPDVIFPDTGGTETIFAFGPVLAAVGSGTMCFINGNSPSTVIGGGSGNAIINGGAGGGLFAGGTGGTNVIIGGSGACTMFGSSGSDLLMAGGAEANLLIAGSGNEP